VHPSIPKHAAVNSAFGRLQKKLGAVRKRINLSAAAEMKSGEYAVAQKWMEVGQAVGDFAQRASTFAQEWKYLVKATRVAARAQLSTTSTAGRIPKSERTPVWKFCAPALKILMQKGGSANLDEIIVSLEESLNGILTESDRQPSKSRGIPRWHSTVQRAYRQCQKEGWIEKQKRRDGVWKITAKGKGVATDNA
jgi:hypothetical protein